MPDRHGSLLRTLIAVLGLALPMAAHARCLLADEPPALLQQWKQSGFAMGDADARRARAHGLTQCLGDPDPFLRDGIAFEALSTWMRGKQLDAATLRALQADLLAQLKGDDADGFRKPFAALVLSEVARTDRVEPWMTTDERAGMASAAAAYLSSVRDHRGYVDGEGWRHGAAHGADWALQLSLNKAVEPVQLWPVLDAVALQVAPTDGHAYAFDEPARLARPLVYAVARGDLDQAAVDVWLQQLLTRLGPRPDGDPQAAWWVRRANTENFLHALGAMLAGEASPPLAAFAASVQATSQKLP